MYVSIYYKFNIHSFRPFL